VRLNPVFDRARRASVTKVEASFAWRSGPRKRPGPCVRPSDLKGAEEDLRPWRFAVALKGQGHSAGRHCRRIAVDAANSQYPRASQGQSSRESTRKVLVRLERDERGAAWLVGRSGGLRAVVSCAADWRAGAMGHDRPLGAITSYLDICIEAPPSGFVASRHFFAASAARGCSTPCGRR